jgi:creatinine amidohydrolase/Fe(II)-dependent formamide hydrolase-like protein
MEEHGPHLPVGTDFLTARDAAMEAIKILNKKNPAYQELIKLGKSGQTKFKIMRTGTAQNTRYVFVK